MRKTAPMRRRSFLLLFSTLAALFLGAFRLLRRPAPPEVPDAGLLAVMLDTLLPADGDWPAASQLGLVDALRRELENQPVRQRALARLLWRVDRHARTLAGQGFGELPPDRRDALLAEILERDSGLAPSFARLRALAFGHYYAHPGVWQRLPGYHPPQPLGYPDYSRPPSHDRPA